MPARAQSGYRLVLYSGHARRNAPLHQSVLDLAARNPTRRDRESIRLTYIPYTLEGSRPYFRRFERRYRAYGGTEFDCIPADAPELASDPAARREATRRLLRSDVVYLSGGNTFYFLAHLRRSGLLPVLRRFAARGGVLAGLSAGAHLLAPDIALAGFPSFDCDQNDVGLRGRGLCALDLVGLEFFPHYRHSPRYRNALAAWSKKTKRPLYACRDGSGLVVEGDRFSAHGDVWLYANGHATKLGA